MVSTRQTRLSTCKHFTCTEIPLSTSMQRKEKGMGLICLSWFNLDLRELSGVFLVAICFFEEIQHYRKCKVVSPSEYQTLPLWAKLHTPAQGRTWPGTIRAPLVLQCPEQKRFCKYLNSNCSNWDRECKSNSLLVTRGHFSRGDFLPLPLHLKFTAWIPNPTRDSSWRVAIN